MQNDVCKLIKLSSIMAHAMNYYVQKGFHVSIKSYSVMLSANKYY